MKIKVGKSMVEGEIPVFFLKEGDAFIAHSPALDLSACGATFEEADTNFTEALEIFFSECRRRGTLEKALEAYGWVKQNGRFSPPHWIGERHISLSELQLA